MFTLLDDAVRGFGGTPAGGWGDVASRRQRLAGVRDPSGSRRPRNTISSNNGVRDGPAVSGRPGTLGKGCD